MNNNLAILDLGTNTFHLLIVEVLGNTYKVLYKEKQFVKLGEFGLHHFNELVLNRATGVVQYYNEKLIEYKVTDAIIFGTAGLRMATNAKTLINEIESITSYKVKTISGTNEAQLIYYGVKQSLPDLGGNYLIMDIGGGSVEFILANNFGVLWAQSFNIGVSLLKNKYHSTDPLTQNQAEALCKFLDKELQLLKNALQKNKTHTLVGASGSFDTIADISANVPKKNGFVQLPLKDFDIIKQDLIAKTYLERLSTKGLANQRADMIVVALLLIDYVLTTLEIKEMYKSDFALKEGIIWAYLNEPEYLKTL